MDTPKMYFSEHATERLFSRQLTEAHARLAFLHGVHTLSHDGRRGVFFDGEIYIFSPDDPPTLITCMKKAYWRTRGDAWGGRVKVKVRGKHSKWNKKFDNECHEEYIDATVDDRRKKTNKRRKHGRRKAEGVRFA